MHIYCWRFSFSRSYYSIFLDVDNVYLETQQIQWAWRVREDVREEMNAGGTVRIVRSKEVKRGIENDAYCKQKCEQLTDAEVQQVSDWSELMLN